MASSLRRVAGIGLALVFAVVVAVFLFSSVAQLLHLYELGIRRDALRLIAIRDFSLAAAICCGGYLVLSLLFHRTTRKRLIALAMLIVFGCSFAVSGYREQQLRTRVKANLEQLRSALEKHDRKQGTTAPPEAER